jgi:hypothetical protein
MVLEDTIQTDEAPIFKTSIPFWNLTNFDKPLNQIILVLFRVF